MATSGKPAKVEQLLAHANDCISRYDLEAALKFYEKALTISPEDTELLDSAGELCLECGRSEDAVKLFTRSIELKPEDNAAKYMNLGQLMAGENSIRHYSKGMEILQRDMKTAGKDTEALAKIRQRLSSGYVSMTEIYMTDLCDEEGAEQKCEELLAAAQQACPDSPEVYTQLASFRLCQCKPEEAKSFTYKAVSLCNKQEEQDRPTLEMRVGIVKLLIELEQLDEAEEFARGLLSVDDQYIETWYLLALINYQQKEWRAANECAQSALKVLEAEGVDDEEQAAKLQELAEQIQKEIEQHGVDEDEEMDDCEEEMGDADD